MGIRFYCPHCDRRLHVKEFLAGRKGICPHCDEGITIPQESTLGPEGSDADEGGSGEQPLVDASRPPEPSGVQTRRSATATELENQPKASADVAQVSDGSKARDLKSQNKRKSTLAQETPVDLSSAEDKLDPIDAAPHLVWYVRPPSGGQYGPAEGTLLRRWLREGRVTEDSLVWQEGWEQWRPAREVFLFANSIPTPPSPEHAPPALPSQTKRTTTESKATVREEDQPIRIGEARERMIDYRLSRSRSQGRQIVIVVSLLLVCVALIVVLGLVVTGRL